MKTLEILPHAGLNRRFPEHKLVGEKKQYTQKLWNMLNLDGRFYKHPGASRYDQTDRGGNVVWAKRIYYQDGADSRKALFAIMNSKFYKGDDSTGTLSQTTISNSLNLSIEGGFYPIDATLKIAGTVVTYLVDGKYFYKYSGNNAGDWERLPIKTDVDGNTIEPTFICEYLDRLWILTKNANRLIGTANLNPELTNDASDSVIIELPPGNGGFPKALVVHPNGYLYIIHEDYFVPLSGSSPATFGVKPGNITKGHGTRAPRSVTVLNNTVGFLESKNNEYHTMDDLDNPLSYDIKLGELIDPVQSAQTVATIDTTLNALRIAYYPSGGTLLGDEEIFSLSEKKWCGETRGRNISCYCQWNGSGDDGRLLTGRSDKGLMMVNDRSFDFDSTPIRVWWVSASYVAADNINDVQFEDFMIDARPDGNYTLPIRYYIDQRLTTYGESSMNMQGEITTLFLIDIAQQKDFLNRDLFLIDANKGRMVRFEIDWEQTNKDLEFYGMYVRYNSDAPRTMKLISGR